MSARDGSCRRHQGSDEGGDYDMRAAQQREPAAGSADYRCQRRLSCVQLSSPAAAALAECQTGTRHGQDVRLPAVPFTSFTPKTFLQNGAHRVGTLLLCRLARLLHHCAEAHSSLGRKQTTQLLFLPNIIYSFIYNNYVKFQELGDGCCPLRTSVYHD